MKHSKPLMFFTLSTIVAFLAVLTNNPCARETRLLNEIVAIIKVGNQSNIELADSARTFVYTYTVHLTEEEKHDGKFLNIFSRMLEAYHKDKPPLNVKCAYRAFALEAILDHMDVENRLVHIYTDEYEVLSGHTFLEVRAHDGSWVIQDPDYDVYYVNKETGARVATLDLVAGNPNDTKPLSNDYNCTFPKKAEAWRKNGIPVLYRCYFESVLYEEERHLIINIDRFKLEKKFSELNFTEFMKQSLGSHKVTLIGEPP